MYTVYAHVNKTNGKIYVGMTSQRVSKRWNNGGGYRRNEYFYRSIQKYGWDGFEHEILASHITKEEAENFEIKLIEKLNTTNPKFGYNITSGGEYYGNHTDETKRKISKNKLGKYTRGNSGAATKVVCEGVVFDCILDCADFYGMPHNSFRNWVCGHNPMPDEFIKKGLSYLNKPTKIRVKKDLKNMGGIKIIYKDKIYESIKDLAFEIGESGSSISAWLLGARKMPENLYNDGLRYLNRDNSKIKPTNKKPKSKVICDGIVYESIKQCADFYNINHNTMICWVNNTRKTPEFFTDLGLKKI